MIIEIRKAGFVNKGAELMLLSILDRLRDACPDARFAMVPTVSRPGTHQPVERILQAGMHPKVSIYHWGREVAGIASLIPATVRQMFGLVADRDVDVVIDAAGFAYGDQWGPDNARELAYYSRKWRKRGAKLVLMPQAFGPFEGRKIRRHMRTAIESCDLVFARDSVSHRYLVDLVGEDRRIRTAPDFTNLLPGTVPVDFDAAACRVALVPNSKMIDMAAAGETGAYLEFMVDAARFLVERNEKPFVLLHEGAADVEIAESISRAAGGIPLIREGDARNLKGILGACYATVGSRFHGLVSALSQGVPSLATGWSHKYAELFADYGFEDGVVDLSAGQEATLEKIRQLVDPGWNASMRKVLVDRSARLKEESKDMWRQVLDTLQC